MSITSIIIISKNTLLIIVYTYTRVVKFTNLRNLSERAKDGTLLWLHVRGFIGATYELGQCYEHGLGVNKDIEKAEGYYRKAAKCGHIHAQTRLELMQPSHYTAEQATQAEQKVRLGDTFSAFELYRFYRESHLAKAIRFLKKAAQAGHEQAMICLALHYKLGIGVRKQIALYAEWLQKAADNGSVYALYELTQGYYMENESEESCKIHIDLLAKAANNGDCVAQCDMADGHDIAFNWFGYDYFGDCKYKDYEECLQASANNGYLPAMSELGTEYRGERYLKRLPKSAKYWIEKAAAAGYADAQFELACMYNEGNCVQANTKLAFQYYKLAADNSYADAQYPTAQFFKDGIPGVLEPDRQQYLHYLQKAAENESPEAQVELSKLYEGSDLLERNDELVIKWLTAPADGAFPVPLAQFNLGIKYRDGLHTPVDLKKAFKYLKLAADNNCEDAYCHLGAMYRRGDGTRVNYKKAFYYFQKATCAFAIAHVGCMFLRGYGVKRDIPQGVEHLQKAAKLNEPHALYHLGECYENGWGLERNRRKAINCYRKAVKFDEDYDDATEALKRLTKK